MAAITGVDIASQTRREHERSHERWASTKVANCTPAEVQRARVAGFEPDAEGEWFVGRDPRRMTPAELSAMGIDRITPMRAIRAKCLDCCAGHYSEVRRCVAVACPNWPLRTGRNPWRGPLSDAHRAASGIALRPAPGRARLG
jgi:hypothetical protein